VARGDHICVRRVAYTHHGVDVGDGTVIHFGAGMGGKADATIRRASMAAFALGGRVSVQAYGRRLPADETVRRALSKVGVSGYHLFANNCEHFVRWCVTGQHRSRQVDQATTTGGVVGITTAGAATGLGIVASVGEVAGLSGSGIMSGLAAVGGSAVGGLMLLGVAPGLLSIQAMRRALRDDEFAPGSERSARRLGRSAAFVGAAAGGLGGVALVAASGVVTGLSAAGIASGLAAIGAVLGGGMAAGAAVVVAIPAFAAAAVAYVAYRLALALVPRFLVA
jgi:hypothetical protein